MPWHLIVRALFVIAVNCAAVLSRPFSPTVTVNLAVGVALGCLMVLVETRLREAEVTDFAGALIGAAIGLRVGQDDWGRLALGGHDRSPRGLPAQLHPAGVPLPGRSSWAGARASG